ncbi:DUF1572 family protein [Brevibacillus choshinensis]|uniref:DUF1572 family protein n=1 Tax=Brevibacillus choshinensis TaxID=54911 RepID=UPI002E1AA761|nr:DUF1572 family protein [Brevibacillus choshinensis]
MEMAHEFLLCTVDKFKENKLLAEKAMEQLTFGELHWAPSSESNSIAIIVKHLSGNMIARWTDFLSSDGEKPNRKRDLEFEGGYASREELMVAWEDGWQTFFDALSKLSDEDLMKTVTIRDEPHTVLKAIIRQVSHYPYHIGQIVYVAKQIKDTSWRNLSVPRGKSLEYTETVKKENKSGQ